MRQSVRLAMQFLVDLCALDVVFPARPIISASVPLARPSVHVMCVVHGGMPPIRFCQGEHGRRHRARARDAHEHIQVAPLVDLVLR